MTSNELSKEEAILIIQKDFHSSDGFTGQVTVDREALGVLLYGPRNSKRCMEVFNDQDQTE